MGEYVEMAVFGVILCLIAIGVFAVRRPFSKLGVRMVPSKNPDRHYTFSIAFTIVVMSIIFFGGLTMIVVGLLLAYGGD